MGANFKTNASGFKKRPSPVSSASVTTASPAPRAQCDIHTSQTALTAAFSPPSVHFYHYYLLSFTVYFHINTFTPKAANDSKGKNSRKLVPISLSPETRAGSEPNLVAGRPFWTAHVLALSLESWFHRGATSAAGLEPRTTSIRGWGRDYLGQ